MLKTDDVQLVSSRFCLAVQVWRAVSALKQFLLPFSFSFFIYLSIYLLSSGGNCVIKCT